MGEVVEVGQGFTKFRKGDRIIVPFNINCGACRQCKLGNYSVCERSNRNAEMAAAQFGYTRPACSATRTSPAATRGARPSTCACRWPTWRP